MSGRLPGLECFLVVDRGHHRQRGVPPVPCCTPRSRPRPGPGPAPWWRSAPGARSSNSSVECQDSMTALSSAEPGRPIDWRMPSRAQAARNGPGGVFAALVGVQDHAGHLAAAHRDRHRQRAVGQLARRGARPGRTRGSAGRPCPAPRPGSSLPSSVAISVPSPYHLRLICVAGKSRLTRSGARHRPLPGPGGALAPASSAAPPGPARASAPRRCSRSPASPPRAGRR